VKHARPILVQGSRQNHLPDRYIEEIGSFTTCEKLITPLPDSYLDKDSLVSAYVCIEAGTIYDRTGRSFLAFDVDQKVHEIRLATDIDNDPYGIDMANGYGLMTLATTAVWKGEEGLTWINKAIQCMTQQSTSDEELMKKHNADRFWRNRGRTNYLLGRYDDAKDGFTQAEKSQFWKDNHYDGESGYVFAQIYYKERNWERALYYAQRAYDFMAPGKPNHATIIATRCLQAIILIAHGEAMP
jgi:tetratricopeptide (TPR) repeat protein